MQRCPDDNRYTNGGVGASKTNAWREIPFPTRDQVHLSGVPCHTAGQQFTVNGYRFVCNSIQFAVLFVLECHSLRFAGRNVPMKVKLNPFLSAKDILEAIEAYAGSVALVNRCRNWTSDDIIRAVYSIRQKVKKHGLNPFIIDRGLNQRGYRLGTHPENVTLTYLDEEKNEVTIVSGKRKG